MTKGNKPDPKELLKQTYRQMQQVIMQLETKMLTIVEVQGWSAEEANEILGFPYFAETKEEVTEDDG